MNPTSIRPLIVLLVLALCSGCSWTVPFVQINIGSNDVSNALFKADKGPRVIADTTNKIGDNTTVTQTQSAEVMDGLTENQSGALDALDNFQRAFDLKEKQDE